MKNEKDVTSQDLEQAGMGLPQNQNKDNPVDLKSLGIGLPEDSETSFLYDLDMGLPKIQNEPSKISPFDIAWGTAKETGKTTKKAIKNLPRSAINFLKMFSPVHQAEMAGVSSRGKYPETTKEAIVPGLQTATMPIAAPPTLAYNALFHAKKTLEEDPVGFVFGVLTLAGGISTLGKITKPGLKATVESIPDEFLPPEAKTEVNVAIERVSESAIREATERITRVQSLSKNAKAAEEVRGLIENVVGKAPEQPAPLPEEGGISPVPETVAGEPTLLEKAQSVGIQPEKRLPENAPYRDMVNRVLEGNGTPEEFTKVKIDHPRLFADPLTGVGNDLDFKLTPREGKAIAVLDVDKFKQINDTQGHSAGDRLLIGISNDLSVAATDRTVNVYRAGTKGDEFILTGSLDDIEAAAEDARDNIRRNFNIDISYGVDERGDIHAADTKMYEMKKGKGITEPMPGEPPVAPTVTPEVLKKIEQGQELTPEEKLSLGPQYEEARPFVQNPEKVGQQYGFPGVKQPRGAISAGSLAYGMKLPEKYINIRLDKISDSYDVQKIILDTAEIFEKQLREARGKNITQAEIPTMAEESGLTFNRMMRKKVSSYSIGEAFAVKEFMNASGKRLLELLDEYKKAPTEENQARALATLTKHHLIQRVYSGVAAQWGRMGHVFKKLSEPGALRENEIKSVIDQYGGKQMGGDVLDALNMIRDDPARMNKFIWRQGKDTFAGRAYRVWINFILSGPKTHVANLAGNTVFLAIKFPETALGAAIESIKSLKPGRARNVFYRELTDNFFGGIAGLKDGIASSMELLKGKKLGESKFGEAGLGKGEIYTPTGALVIEDAIFESLAYKSELYAQARIKALREGLGGDALSKRIAELVETPTDDIDRLARRESAYRTFKSELGRIGKAVSAIKQGAWGPGAQVFAKMFIPFHKFAFNCFKASFLERTPIGLARALIEELRPEKTMTPRDLSLLEAKAAIGSAISLATAFYVLDGNITGGGPNNKNQRDIWLTTHQPYSFKIGKKWYSYRRIEPIATMVGVLADIFEGAKYNQREAEQTDEEFYTSVAKNIIAGTTKNLMDKTYLSGLGNMFDALNDPARYGDAMVRQLSGSLIPNIIAQISAAVDPNYRQARTLVDNWKKRVPGISKEVQPYISIFGEPEQKPGGLISRLFSPAEATKLAPIYEDVVDELMRVGYFPGKPKDTIGKIKLTPEEYTQYQEITGKLLFEAFKRLLETAGYKAMTKEQKEQTLRSLATARGSVARITMIQKIARRLRGEGERKALLEER
jgi:GGDEF domain-containing protein